MAKLRYKFLQSLGKAVLNSVGGGILGDVLTDLLPDLAKKAWAAWSKETDDDERREELQALAQAPPEQIKSAVGQFVQEAAGNQPAHVREELAAYLSQVPATLRQSFRRAADPSGRSVPSRVHLRGPDDLVPLLPAQMPRFKPGDRPLPGVDLELVELLGVGGFGEVWKARNPHVEGMPAVALKFCLSKEAKERLLLHEAKVLAQVMKHGKHAGIVQLQSTYFNNDTPCLQYEYISGGDFAGHIRELHAGEIPPTPQQIAELMLTLCDIVGYAHGLEPAIVHRDLKPANILVQRMKSGDIRLKIADFGIGGLAASQALHVTGKQDSTKKQNALTSALRGSHTPLYASPQQAEGRDPDPRDDVFSLGVIWYQMLTGELGIGRPGGTRWTERLGEKGVPRSQVKLLARCFEDNPSDRPANAGVLADALRATLEKHAPSGDASEKKRKKKETKDPEKQRRLLIGAGAGGLLILLIGLVLILNGGKKEPKEEENKPAVKDSSAGAEFRALLSRGDEALRKKDGDGALKAFEEAVAADATQEDGYLGRGKAQHLKKKFDKASADFTKALEINDKNPRTYELRAASAYQQGNLDQVITDASQALKLAPPALGNAGGPMGQGGQPLTVGTGVLENPVRLYELRAIAHCYLARYTEARADCTTGLQLDARDVELLNLRGITHANQGKFDEAIADYTAALAQQADYLPAHFNRALAQGGFSRRHDAVVAQHVARWRLPATLAWAFADNCPVPVRKDPVAPPSTTNTSGGAAAGGGGQGGGGPGAFGAFGGVPGGGPGFPGQGVPAKAALVPSPLPWLTPPSIDRLLPSPRPGPPLPVLSLGPMTKGQGQGGFPSGPGASAPPGGFGPGPGGAGVEDLSSILGCKGDLKLAGEDLDAALARAPQSGPAHFNRGWVWYSTGNYEQALKSFKQVLSVDSPSAVGHYYCGLAQLGKGEPAEAVKSFNEALRLEGEYVWALKDRAIALTALQRQDEARADLELAAKLAPTSIPLTFSTGLCYLRVGPAAKAKEPLDAVLKHDNKYVPAYLARGQVSVLQGDHDQAILLYNQALNLDTRSAAGHVLRGRAFALKGKHQAAAKEYETAAGFDEQNSTVLIVNGFSHCQRPDAKAEDIDKAIDSFSRALRHDSDDKMILVYRALAYYRKGADGLAAAERDCTEALEKTEWKDETAYLLRGKIRFAAKKYDKALEDYNQLLTLNANNVQALLARSEGYAASKKFKEALKDCADALVIAKEKKDDSGQALSLHYQGTWHFLSPMRNYPQAIKDLTAATKLDPTNPVHYFQRGNIHFTQGSKEAAEIDYATAQRLSLNAMK